MLGLGVRRHSCQGGPTLRWRINKHYHQGRGNQPSACGDDQNCDVPPECVVLRAGIYQGTVLLVLEEGKEAT